MMHCRKGHAVSEMLIVLSTVFIWQDSQRARIRSVGSEQMCSPLSLSVVCISGASMFEWDVSLVPRHWLWGSECTNGLFISVSVQARTDLLWCTWCSQGGSVSDNVLSSADGCFTNVVVTLTQPPWTSNSTEAQYSENPEMKNNCW